MPRSTLHEHPDAGREGLRRVLVDGAPAAHRRARGRAAPDRRLAGRAAGRRARAPARGRRPRAAARSADAPRRSCWRPSTSRRCGPAASPTAARPRRASRSPRWATSTSWSTRRSAPSSSSRRPPRACRRRARRCASAPTRPGTSPSPSWRWCSTPRGQIVGYLAADDVSSRSIEGANPLYLPQAKVYDDSLGPVGHDRPGPRRPRPALGGDRARDPPRRRAHLRRRDVGRRDEAQLRRARGRALSRALLSRRRGPAHRHRRRPAGRAHPAATATACGSPWRASGVLEHDIYRSSG